MSHSSRRSLQIDLHPTLGLVASRRSGACFGGPYEITSAVFNELLQTYDELATQIAHLREELLTKLTDAVPGGSDQEVRAWLLCVRRHVYNHRWTNLVVREGVSAPLAEKLNHYIELCRSRQVLIDHHRSRILDEIREKLSVVLRDPVYRAAVAYSCPWLLPNSPKKAANDIADFSARERGLYSYAVKFFSKANPFHTFASVGFSSSSELNGVSDCELVINSSLIENLETELLPFADARRRLLYLTSFTEKKAYFQFVSVVGPGIRLIEVKSGPFIREVCRFLGTGGIGRSVKSCVEHLADVFSTCEQRVVGQLTALVNAGVLVQYLVRDFNVFGQDLLGIKEDRDPAIHELQRLHLSAVTKERVGPIVDGVRTLNASMSAAEENLVFVNTYHRGTTPREEEFAKRCMPDLTAVKPLLTLRHNFSEHAAVLRDYIFDRCMSEPRNAIPYLAAVREFVKDSAEIVRHWRSVGKSWRRLRALDYWLSRLADLEGNLNVTRLRAMLRECPERPRDKKVCFCGPVDLVDNAFFLTNIFAGDGRYLSRYFVGRRQVLRKPPCSDDALDVQLMVPSRANRMHIAPQFSVGCSFDKRFSHLFDEWVDPAEIVIESVSDDVVYRHKNSGKRLRFHFCGFRLAESLPAPYQLLLTAHADSYRNPFLLMAQNSGEIHHQSALWYGGICLRRETWKLSANIINNTLLNSDLLTATVKCRNLLREVCSAEDRWYFRTVTHEGYMSKPRYLDVRNPLSVGLFRREVKRSTCTNVALCPMAPSVSHLNADSGGYTTELMIEA